MAGVKARTTMRRNGASDRWLAATCVARSAVGLMCAEDLTWLNDWRPRYRRSDDAILSRTGWTELREIGELAGQWSVADCRFTVSRC